MTLTDTERWILANQYRILEALQPAGSPDTQDLAIAREVVERGYEYLYSEVSPVRYEAFSGEAGDEVVSILQMFRIVKASFDRLPDKEGVNARYTTFGGFDGNNEGQQFGFAKFFCSEMGRFDEFNAVDFNSHSERLPKYRRMLAKLNAAEYEDFLNKEQIIEITSA